MFALEKFESLLYAGFVIRTALYLTASFRNKRGSVYI